MTKFVRPILIIFGIVTGALCLEIVLRVFQIKHNLNNDWLLNNSDKKVSRRYIFENIHNSFIEDANKYRIAVIGDSFSEKNLWKRFGVTSYPELLSQIVATRSANIKIYNYGLGATGPDQEFRYFLEKILSIKPNLVIWQIYENDIWDNVDQAVYTISSTNILLPIDTSANWMYRRQKVYDIFSSNKFIASSYILNNILYLIESRSNNMVPLIYKNDPYSWGLKKIYLEFDEMNKLSEKYGFAVVYILIPSQANYLHGYSTKEYKDLSYLINKQKNKLVITFNTIQKANGNVLGKSSDESIANKMYLGKEDLNSIGDKHLNQMGQSIVAKELLEVLEKSRLSY